MSDASARYVIESLGHHPLPRELTVAAEANVDDVLRRAARFIGLAEVTIERVSSVIPGSCIACTDVVAYVQRTPMLVARVALD